MSVTFERKLRQFAADTMGKFEMLRKNVDNHVGRSIRVGSPVTGAPGQPVRFGKLLASWYRVDLGPSKTAWRSNAAHAHVIEYNLRGAQLRSSVGGFHSVTITRLGFHAIVRYELGKLNKSSRDASGRLRNARGQFMAG